jgi:hypothetical protein
MKTSTRIIDYHLKGLYRRRILENHEYRKLSTGKRVASK